MRRRANKKITKAELEIVRNLNWQSDEDDWGLLDELCERAFQASDEAGMLQLLKLDPNGQKEVANKLLDQVSNYSKRGHPPKVYQALLHAAFEKKQVTDPSLLDSFFMGGNANPKLKIPEKYALILAKHKDQGVRSSLADMDPRKGLTPKVLEILANDPLPGIRGTIRSEYPEQFKEMNAYASSIPAIEKELKQQQWSPTAIKLFKQRVEIPDDMIKKLLMAPIKKGENPQVRKSREFWFKHGPRAVALEVFPHGLITPEDIEEEKRRREEKRREEKRREEEEEERRREKEMLRALGPPDDYIDRLMSGEYPQAVSYKDLIHHNIMYY